MRYVYISIFTFTTLLYGILLIYSAMNFSLEGFLFFLMAEIASALFLWGNIKSKNGDFNDNGPGNGIGF